MHNIHMGTSTHIICQCGVTFEHCKSYKRHVKQHHDNRHVQRRPEVAVGEVGKAHELHDLELDFYDGSDREDLDDESFNNVKESLEDDMLLFISRLKFNAIPETCIKKM